MNNEIQMAHVEFCESMKKDYYSRCIKMLYEWSLTTEDDIKRHVNALGLFDYNPSITWLLSNKTTLNAQIQFALGALFKCPDFDSYHAILDKLKVALVVCNKNQAITILTAITLNSSDPKHDIQYLSTF